MRFRRHLSYANVAATIALVVAVAGGSAAIAGNKIGAQDIKKIKVRQAEGTNVVTSPCRSGEKLIGGGGVAVGLGASRPNGNGWLAAGAVGEHTTAYALCLPR